MQASLSNDLFLYFVIGTWSSPTVTGTRPPPCHGSTLTMVDGHRVVLFGGRGSGFRSYQHVYILDLQKMVSCM